MFSSGRKSARDKAAYYGERRNATLLPFSIFDCCKKKKASYINDDGLVADDVEVPLVNPVTGAPVTAAEVRSGATRLTVAQLSSEEQRIFLYRTLWVATLLTAAAFGAEFLIMKFTDPAPAWRNTMATPLAVAFSLIVLLIIFKTRLVSIRSYAAQSAAALFALTMSVVTLAVVVRLFEITEMVYLQISITTTAILFCVAVYRTQTIVRYSNWVSATLSILIIGALAYVLIYVPNQEFWNDPVGQYARMDSPLLLQVFGMLSVTTLVIIVGWRIPGTMYTCTREQWIYAGAFSFLLVISIGVTAMYGRVGFTDNGPAGGQAEPGRSADAAARGALLAASGSGGFSRAEAMRAVFGASRIRPPVG
jgi:hypothetical protein